MDQMSFLGEIEKRESLEHFFNTESKKTIRIVKDIEQYYAGIAGVENEKYHQLLDQLMQDCVDELTNKRKLVFEEKIKDWDPDRRKTLNTLLERGEFSSARDLVESPEAGFSNQSTVDNEVFAKFWAKCDTYAKQGNEGAKYSNGLKKIIEKYYKLSETNSRKALEISELWPKTDFRANSSSTVFNLLTNLNDRFTKTEDIASAKVITTKENGVTVQRMNLPIRIRKESSGDYSGRAPVPEFGCNMKSLDVALILTSSPNVDSRSLLKTISSLCGSITKTETPLLVLLNRALSCKDWQTLSCGLKTLGDRQAVLVLDWSIVLHAVLTDRENKVDAWDRIMKCALPLHGLNPFPEGSARISPELFSGRKKTISKFLSHPAHAHFLYGGRQLGKTAIFNFVNDISDDIIVQTAILGKSGAQALELIGGALCSKLNSRLNSGESSFKQPDTWDDLRGIIKKAVERPENQEKKLILFVDEADAFLDKLRHDFERQYDPNTDPIQQLYSIKEETNGRFHFAFAGKHNVFRFYHWCQQKGGNIDWPAKTKEAVPVNPFSYAEADELLSKLSYFNIRFEDSDKAKRRIFNEANYYPGLIHLFCHDAVKRVNENFQRLAPNDSEGVKNAGVLKDDDISAIIRSADFRQSQRNLFDITLKLTDTEEEAYLCVAYALAYLSLQTGKSSFTANDVMKDACAQFRKLAKENIPMYLEELCELSILDKIGEGNDARYFFKRDRYRDYLRPDDSDDDDEIIYKFWELEAMH